MSLRDLQSVFFFFLNFKESENENSWQKKLWVASPLRVYEMNMTF